MSVSQAPPARAAAPSLSSRDLEVLSGLLATITHNFILNGLALVEGAQAGSLDRRDMDEHVLASRPAVE